MFSKKASFDFRYKAALDIFNNGNKFDRAGVARRCDRSLSAMPRSRCTGVFVHSAAILDLHSAPAVKATVAVR